MIVQVRTASKPGQSGNAGGGQKLGSSITLYKKNPYPKMADYAAQFLHG